MPNASCLCGNLKIRFTGEPVMNVSCHCLPCRKSSGTTNSCNVLVTGDQFMLEQGQPKTWVRKGDSGQNVTYHFCPVCPSLMWISAESYPNMYILKAGTFDATEDIEKLMTPEKEIYTKHRIAWTKPFGVEESLEG